MISSLAEPCLSNLAGGEKGDGWGLRKGGIWKDAAKFSSHCAATDQCAIQYIRFLLCWCLCLLKQRVSSSSSPAMGFLHRLVCCCSVLKQKLWKGFHRPQTSFTSRQHETNARTQLKYLNCAKIMLLPRLLQNSQ